MGKRFESCLKKIPRSLQKKALTEINKARKVFGGKPLTAIVIANTANDLGGSTTPVGKSIGDLLTPNYEDGSGFIEIAGLYPSVWDVPDEALAARLARAWGTESKRMKTLEYCCHRHFADEVALVVTLPQALQDYENAVIDASDEAQICACGTAWYDRYECVCGVPDENEEI